VFDEAELQKQNGKVTAYDSPIYIADAALYLKTHEPDRGIENPYELDQRQFDAAIDLLKQQRESIGEYWSDYTKQIQSFANGDTVVGTTWPYQYLTLKAEGKPVNAVYAFRRGKELEAAGHRVQHWECETSNNDVFEKGTTTSRLPGESGFKDARGTTLFPELPGQSRDPIYNTTLPSGKEQK
jgi:hypothetical protein